VKDQHISNIDSSLAVRMFLFTHRITDILKATASQEDSCEFSYGGFERAAELDTPNQHYSTPQLIHDVLNTPQQVEKTSYTTLPLLFYF